jgi:uncharacterized delta-60 repeat protein
MYARAALGSFAAAVGSMILLTGLAGAAPGDLDPSFGTDGKVVVPIATYGAMTQGSALQADNKIVIAGTNLQTAPPPPPPSPHGRPGVEDEDFFALRLTANGAVDSSFGTAGIVRTPINLDPGARDVARGVAVAPDGAIVVVGDAWRANFSSDLAFVRYTPAGELDSSFSGDGIQTVDLGSADIGYQTVVQPDRKPVAVAATTTYRGFETVRLNADGEPDQSFGTGGIVRTPVGDPTQYDDSMTLALDGSRIIVAGAADSATGSGDFALVRYLSDGQPDPTFGAGGIVITPDPENALIRAVAVTNAGKIVAAGYVGSGGTTLRLRLARYLADGNLDATFGGTGIVTTPIGNYAGALSLALAPDGKIIAGGWTSGGPSFALARYNDDGSLDASFGDGGTRIYRVGTHGGDGTSVLLQHLPDGRDRLVQTGTAWEDDGGRFAAIGLRLDGVANPPPPPPPPPVPPPGPPPVPPPPPAQRHCLVPRVVGMRLVRAKKRIRARHCAVGRIRRASSRRPRGRVVRQSPRAGLRKPLRSRVSLVVSRGKR